MSYRIRRHGDPDAFLARARDWLLRSEAENNLILGIVQNLRSGAQRSEGPPYLVTVERGADGPVVGCAVRTPPWKPILTRMPVEAVPALVQDLGLVYKELPAVLGPDPPVRRFAREWARLRGVEVRPGMEQRVHQLSEVQRTPDPSGAARWAREEEVTGLVAWFLRFAEEAGVPPPQRARWRVGRLVADGDVALWEDDGPPVSMAARSGRTPHGVRIGPVYTPPEFRGRGYATGVTAWLSRRSLAQGLKRCFLYTDLSNPVSNRLYRRIGYRPVMDVRDYEFDLPGGSAEKAEKESS